MGLFPGQGHRLLTARGWWQGLQRKEELLRQGVVTSLAFLRSHSQTRMRPEVIAFALWVVPVNCNFVALWHWARKSEGIAMHEGKGNTMWLRPCYSKISYPQIAQPVTSMWNPSCSCTKPFNLSLYVYLLWAPHKSKTNGVAWPTLHAPACTSLFSHFFPSSSKIPFIFCNQNN